jgi:hypothetical protein
MLNDQQITALLAGLQRSLDEAGLAGGRLSGGLALGATDQPAPAGSLLLEGSIYRPGQRCGDRHQLPRRQF